MYAIVEIAGFDYKVKKGDKISVPHQDAEEGAKLEFSTVKLLKDDAELKINPTAKVVAKVLGHRRGKKVIVYKFKKRKGYRRKGGYRDMRTDLEVTAISSGKAAAPVKSTKQEKPAATDKAKTSKPETSAKAGVKEKKTAKGTTTAKPRSRKPASGKAESKKATEKE